MRGQRLLSRILFLIIIPVVTSCVLILHVPAGTYCIHAARYLHHLFSCVCLFRTLYSFSDSNSLQMWLDVSRTHQSVKIRQLPWSSGLQPNESVCGGKQNQVTLPTTQPPLCSWLHCQLRMSHLVLMFVYPQLKLCGQLLDWDAHMNQSQCEQLYLKHLRLHPYPSVCKPAPRNYVHIGPFHT